MIEKEHTKILKKLYKKYTNEKSKYIEELEKYYSNLRNANDLLRYNYFKIVRTSKNRYNKQYLESRVSLLDRKRYFTELIKMKELQLHKIDEKLDRIELEIQKELN